MEEDFTCLLIRFNKSKNKLMTIKDNYLHNADHNTDELMGLLTSYVLGNFKENHTEKFLLQYC